MTDLLGKKRRKTEEGEQPYLTFYTAVGYFGEPVTWHVLKTHQNDQTKQYARWLVQAISGATGPHGDYGDAYVYDVIVSPAPTLVAVDGRTPTEAELEEVRGWAANAIDSGAWG